MRQTGRHRSRRSTAAATGRMGDVVWIARGTRLEVSKFGGNCFADYQGAGALQLRQNMRFVAGKQRVRNIGAGACRKAIGMKDVFDAKQRAEKRRPRGGLRVALP